VKLPRDVSGAKAVKALERIGFSVTTLQSILRQAGLTVDGFLDALP